MSQQIQITGGAKVRNLEGVLTGTAGVVNSLGINVPDGIPQLDGSGKILVDQLPNSIMEYKGTWNAATNTPTLANGTGNAGDVYLCNVAGTTDFGAGGITFAVGDQVLYSGTTWEKASGATGTVTSVAVTESGDALTITGSPITTSGTINIGFAGNSGQYINGEGNLTTFPTIISEAQNLISEVYNETGATLTKGTIVYINGGHGNLPTVTKAIATGDATSAQTYGVVRADISNNNNGYVTVFGSLTDIDTQAYAAGTQLYLSGTTAGAWTSTKPSAPIHLVYIGIVVRSHPTQGVVEIRIQNGYELEELHDVAISSVANNDGIFYNSSNSLWENKTIDEALGYTPANASLVVPYTGATANLDLGGYSLYLNNSQAVFGRNFTGTTSYALIGVNASNKVSIDNSALGTIFGGSLTGQTYIANGIGTQGGTIALKQNGLLSASAGYTTLGALSAGQLVIYFGDTNAYAATFLNTSLTASQSYTLPDASGTLALTSNLSSYLPLSGGTLTGALSGTSATFSGNVGINGGDFRYRPNGDVTNSPALVLKSPTAGVLSVCAEVIGDANAASNSLSFRVSNVTSGRFDALTIASTGAATFSSSVTAGGVLIVNVPTDNTTVGIFHTGGGTTNRGLKISTFAATNDNAGVTLDAQTSTGVLAFATAGAEKMRITSGGNVGIGTSSPSARLAVLKSQSGTSAADSGVLRLENTGANYTSTLVITDGTTNDALISYLGATQSLGFGVGSTANQMVLNSSGNVGIGTSSPSSSVKLEVYDSSANGDIAMFSTAGTKADIWLKDVNTSAGAVRLRSESNSMIMTAGGTERMRITSGGLMLLGATSSYTDYGLIQITGDNKGIAIRDSDGFYRAIYNQSGTLYFYNGSNEGYLNTAGAWVNASDVSIKKNVKDLEYGLKEVLNLKPKSYKMINNDLAQIGFIAQEVGEILPELVDESKKGMKGLSYGQMTAVLVKAIQEQQQQIEELKALINK